MRKSVSALSLVLLLTFFVGFLLSPPSVLGKKWDHWRHDYAQDIDPYEGLNTFWNGAGVYEYLEEEVADEFCDYLWRPAVRGPGGDPGGITQQLQGAMRAFNSVEDEERGAVSINKPNKTWKGFTLLSSAGAGIIYHDPDPEVDGDELTYRAALINMNGDIVHGWNNIGGVPYKMLPRGHIMGGNVSPGFGGASVVINDWCDNTVWEYEGLMQYDEDGTELGKNARQHHDFQREGNPVGYYVPGMEPKLHGKSLILASHDPESDLDSEPNCPDTSHISNFRLVDDAIYEVAADGETILWRWFACEHFEEMGFSDTAKQGIRNVRLGGGGAGRDGTDWTHFNNANYLGPNQWWNWFKDWRFHPDNIIFDSRSSGMIGIIARHAHPKGHFEEGEIVWRVGPDYMNGPEVRLGQIIGPHAAHMIPMGLPGAGNILVFDNGGNSTFGTAFKGCSWIVDVLGEEIITEGVFPAALRDFSRILEFDPITKEVVWEYKNKEEFIDDDGNVNRKFFSTFISNVQRLPNGNTLICEGNMGRIFEITKHGEIVWEYIARSNSAGAPGVIGQAVYRAYRVPYRYVPRYLLHKACPEPEPTVED